MTSETDANGITIYEEIFPSDTNPYGTAFGGKILSLMDRCAALAASRYAHRHFVTASLDALDFRAPVRQGEITRLDGRVVYTSRRTIGIRVEVFAVDKVTWQKRKCCEGMLFLVAVGPENAAGPIPRLVPGDDDEQKAWDAAAAIHHQMLQRKKG